MESFAHQFASDAGRCALVLVHEGVLSQTQQDQVLSQVGMRYCVCVCVCIGVWLCMYACMCVCVCLYMCVCV